MITSPDNQHLKTIRGLREKKLRSRTGLFAVEGEDLIAAAEAAGVTAEIVLRGGIDVEQTLLDRASLLGSGTRVIGVYRQRWASLGGAALTVYLENVGDPGNLGTIIRTAHALCDGPVVLGPGCADPYSPKAVRASMGSIFARPPARATLADLNGTKVCLDGSAELDLRAVGVSPPLVICLGGERSGLSAEALALADRTARIPMAGDGPESLNVAAAAAIALHELGNRMADDG